MHGICGNNFLQYVTGSEVRDLFGGKIEMEI